MISASISVMAVRSSSKEKCALTISFCRQHFVDLMSLSKAPPHQGARSTLNCQAHPIPVRYSPTVWSSNTALMYFEAALNVFPLSDRIFRGRPLREANLFKHLRNDRVDMSVTISKCTASVTKHVNRQIHTFCEPVAWSTQMVSGPAKSTPVYEKAGSSFTRKTGRGGGGGLLKGAPSNLLQSVQW